MVNCIFGVLAILSVGSLILLAAFGADTGEALSCFASMVRDGLRERFRLYRPNWREIFRKTWNSLVVIAVAAIIVNQVALSYMMFRLWPLIEKLSAWV